MPMLTVTQKEGESDEEFAARISAEMKDFFANQPEDSDQAEPAPSDDSAEPETSPETPEDEVEPTA